ncbi:MAG: hypothetical protein IT384_25175 [Deltaproteobacteria bacterium]|nr:hypothetical protein [Deltaproteobacteria bacterium]
MGPPWRARNLDYRKQVLEPLASALSHGIRTHDLPTLSKAVGDLSRLSQKEMFRLLTILDPEIRDQLSATVRAIQASTSRVG